MVKAKEKDLVEVCRKLAEKLLQLMGSKAKLEMAHDKANEAIVVNLQTDEETGLLIGHHGETLLAIQAALGMIMKQKVGEWVRVIVNVGDWREKQESHLKELAKEAAQRAKETGKSQPIYNLTPAQRRIVHLELALDPEILSESTGEGEERYLVVSLKKT